MSSETTQEPLKLNQIVIQFDSGRSRMIEFPEGTDAGEVFMFSVGENLKSKSRDMILLFAENAFFAIDMTKVEMAQICPSSSIYQEDDTETQTLDD